MLSTGSKTRKIGKLYHIANAARDRRDWKGARAAYSAIVDIDPTDSAAWVQLGHALKESVEVNEAEAAYLKAASLMPTDADIQLQLGHLFKIMNLRDESIAAYRAAHVLDPAAPDPVKELNAYGVELETVSKEHSQSALEAASLGGADSHKPYAVDSTTSLEDVDFLYRIFLGREREAEAVQDPRIGAGIEDVARQFIQSSEFMQAVHGRMIAGKHLLAPLFQSPPTEELRAWVATRLPLSLESGSRVARAASWYELHSAIFADPAFTQGVVGADSPVVQLRTAPLPTNIQEVIIEDSRLFERDWYLETYLDVARSGGDPLSHFVMHGLSEGRNPNRLFDTRWYLSEYPHIRLEKINPLTHYILKGAKLGYDPHPFFSTKEFLKNHPLAADSDLTPLAYFLNRIVPANPAFFPKFGPYDVYKATQENYRRLEQAELMGHIKVMTFTPTFLVWIDGEDDDAVKQTRSSLLRQIYRNFRLVSSLNEVALLSEVSLSLHYLLWLDAGDELSPEALYELASTLNGDPTLDLIYFDHEVALERGLSEPFHKPGWSPDYLESFNYIGSAACFEASKAAKLVAKADSRFDFVLRFTESSSQIKRLDQVLLRTHSSMLEAPSPERNASNTRAIAGRLQRTGRKGRISASFHGANCYNIDIALRTAPLVSIILPTAGRIIDYGGRRLDLIVDCLESVIERSTYKNIEFIVVDNGDLDRDRLKHIKFDRIKFATYELPEVNIAKKVNLGASLAAGEIFLILNDDIEVLASDWIERMLAHFEKPHVGIVGAKLLYPDRTIQHAGIVICGGDPEHVRRGKPRDDIGYWFSNCCPRNYLAVTGAVSMTKAEYFWRMGGYEEGLPINYNDVDFCYKLTQAGYHVVYEPRAELIHYESASIDKSPRPGDAMLFAAKWAGVVDDAFYSEYCLSKRPAMFEPDYTERGY